MKKISFLVCLLLILSTISTSSASAWTHIQTVACLDVKDGPIQWSKVPIATAKVFSPKDDIYIFSEIQNVTVNHRFKVEVYHNGKFFWKIEEDWRNVGNGWEYSFFSPYQSHSEIGDYEAVVTLDYGKGYKLLKKIQFSVIEGARIVIPGMVQNTSLQITNTLSNDVIFEKVEIMNESGISEINLNSIIKANSTITLPASAFSNEYFFSLRLKISGDIIRFL